MPLANVNGVDLFYEESGSGEPIIFQHGYTGAHESWDGVIERMRDRYRCIAIDARGAGDSSHPEDGYTIEQMAADVVGHGRRLWASSASTTLARAWAARSASSWDCRTPSACAP